MSARPGCPRAFARLPSIYPATPPSSTPASGRPLEATRDAGDRWAASLRSAALLVPSMLVPAVAGARRHFQHGTQRAAQSAPPFGRRVALRRDIVPPRSAAAAAGRLAGKMRPANPAAPQALARPGDRLASHSAPAVSTIAGPAGMSSVERQQQPEHRGQHRQRHRRPHLARQPGATSAAPRPPAASSARPTSACPRAANPPTTHSTTSARNARCHSAAAPAGRRHEARDRNSPAPAAARSAPAPSSATRRDPGHRAAAPRRRPPSTLPNSSCVRSMPRLCGDDRDAERPAPRR